MATNCNECIHNNVSPHCKLVPDITNCKLFTLKPNLLSIKLNQNVNESTKDKLYDMFFNTIRMYLDQNSPYNQYDDILLYYSIDQNKFLKRHSNNREETANWIPITFNIHHFNNLKDILGFQDPKNTLSKKGRLINNKYIKDDIFLSFEGFCKVTFKYFYDKHKYVIPNQTQLNGTSKSLF